MFFWSLSGFLLKVIQSKKGIYLKELNIFVLRQINAKINTTVVSMTIICLMLFMTIGVLSSALSLNNAKTEVLRELTPVDINIIKTMDLPSKGYAEEQVEDSKISIAQSLKKLGFKEQNLKDTIEISQYATSDITIANTLGDTLSEVQTEFPFLQIDSVEPIMKLSDYNKVAKLYGNEEYNLDPNHYIIVCDYTNTKEIRDKALQAGTQITINGKQYSPQYEQCKEGFIEISSNHINTGILIIPDDAVSGIPRKKNCFIANYNANTKEEMKGIEQQVRDVIQQENQYLKINTKLAVYENTVGLGAMVTFIGIYLGIIFLISGAAILALKELSESSDNKQRYAILRKIGTDEKMINKALFKQIAIFFIIPLLLAIVHAIFGIQFANFMFNTLGQQNLLTSIFATAIFIIAIYGGYFIATYMGSKRIIKEE